MRIRFHVRMAVLTQLSKSTLRLCAVIFVATLLSLGMPLNLGEFFPASFAQFFLWFCAFPLLTLGAALGSVVDLNSNAIFQLLACDKMQMISIGILAELSVFIYWASVRYAVLKYCGTEWVKACTTIVKCFIFWGVFQILCVLISYAWTAGGFNLGKPEQGIECAKSENVLEKSKSEKSTFKVFKGVKKTEQDSVKSSAQNSK